MPSVDKTKARIVVNTHPFLLFSFWLVYVVILYGTGNKKAAHFIVRPS